MNALTKIFVAIAIIIGFTVTAKAQNAGASATASASCTIINPIAVAETSDLSFGVLSVQSTQGGTCILSAGGVRTSTGGVNLPTSGTAGKNAAFIVTGEANTTYAIVLPANVSLNSGVNSMEMNAMSARFNGKDSDSVTGTLNASGTDSFNVGGTLNVFQAQNIGRYEGTFPVTIAYN